MQGYATFPKTQSNFYHRPCKVHLMSKLINSSPHYGPASTRNANALFQATNNHKLGSPNKLYTLRQPQNPKGRKQEPRLHLAQPFQLGICMHFLRMRQSICTLNLISKVTFNHIGVYVFLENDIILLFTTNFELRSIFIGCANFQ